MIPHVRVLLTALLTTVAAPAVAFDFTFPWIDREASFEITETLVLDYHDDNYDYLEAGPNPYNDNYGDVRNRLNLKLTVGEFDFAFRLDTAVFIRAPGEASPPYLSRVTPEKKTARWLGKHLQVELGDFYASFGRGIALRIRKTDELGEDTTLLGGKVRAHLGPFEVTALAGLSNPTNTDGIKEKTVEDPYDLIAGLRATGRIWDTVVLGVHGVGVIINPLDTNEHARQLIEMSALYDRALVVGTSIDVPDLSDLVSLYAEFNWLEKSLKLSDLPANEGWAAYLGGNLSLGDWTFITEFKWYDDYNLYTETDKENGNYISLAPLNYIRPPTLEPADMEVTNNYDVTGARLKVDWRPGGGDTMLFASYAGFLAHDTGVDEERWIYNLQAGAEQFFLKRGRAKVEVGLREEIPGRAMGVHHHLIYLNADVKVPLTTRHSLSAQGFNWWAHMLQAPSAYDYLRGEWTLAYSWSPLLTVGVILGYDTKLSQSRDLEIITDIPGHPVRQVFLAGSLSVNLSSRVVFNLLAGQMRGGPKCVSGVCRVFPPFAGVRLETVIRL